MKKLLIIFCCLFFSLTTFGQSKDISLIKKEIKAFKLNKSYYAGYDKSKDVSSVGFYGDPIDVTSSATFGRTLVYLGVDFYFKGQTLAETPNDFALKISSYRKGGWLFLKDRSLNVIADGQRFEMPEGRRDSSTSGEILNNLRTSETLTFPVKRGDLRKFASAQSLEIKVGDKSFVLKPEQQQILKHILTVSEIK